MLGEGGKLMQLFSGNDDGCGRGGLRGCMLWRWGEVGKACGTLWWMGEGVVRSGSVRGGGWVGGRAVEAWRRCCPELDPFEVMGRGDGASFTFFISTPVMVRGVVANYV